MKHPQYKTWCSHDSRLAYHWHIICYVCWTVKAPRNMSFDAWISSLPCVAAFTCRGGQSHVGGAQGLFRRNPGWHDRHLGRLWKTEEKPEMLVMGWSDRSWLGLEMFYFLALQFWLLCKWCVIVCQLRRMICNEEPALFGGSLSSHVVLFPQTVWPHGVRTVIVKARCSFEVVSLRVRQTWWPLQHKSSSIFCFRRKSRTKQWPGDLSRNPLVTLGLSHRSHCGAVIILRSLAQPSWHVGLSNCSRCGTRCSFWKSTGSCAEILTRRS